MADTWDKYITFKREEFMRCMNSLRLEVDGSIIDDIVQRELVGTTIIRDQDIFSGPALHEYAGQIDSTLKILSLLGIPCPPGLSDVRDYFHERALEADDCPVKKLPD